MTDYERHYRQCLANGCSERLAEMLASQQSPSLKTDTRRAIGHGTVRDQHKGQTKDVIRATQRENKGWTPPYTWVRNSNLAQSPGDKLAWCPPHEIASHMRKVAKLRGHRLVSDDGKVIVEGRKPTEDPMNKRVKLAPSLVKEELRKRYWKNPEIAKLPRAEQRELCRQIVAEHGQK